MEARIAQVAVKAGVSIATVSRAFAKPDMVSPKTRKRVYAAAEALNYSISRSATAMKTGHSFRIALLISEDIATWFNANVFSGLNAVLAPAGYDIVIYQIENPQERHDFFSTLPVRRNADAVIVSSFAIETDETQRLRSVHVPIIGINPPEPKACDASVGIDDRAGMRRMTEYLISLGHTDIAYISPIITTKLSHSAELRALGFQDACNAANSASSADAIIPVDPHDNDQGPSLPIRARELLFDEHAPHPMEQLADRIVQLGDDMPTALCCYADMCALPLAFALQRRGVAVPGRISLSGFDDAAYSEQYGLTTMHQDPRSLGQAAARITLNLINEQDEATPENEAAPIDLHELVELRLMPRATTGTPASR
ncbi:LacI family DNA-binding transcriptional regulator [Bifidobacterium aerophilum]|uniref:LacI family DNA-binding transcriptional regulator n=1 Tax=Bifidobacterium aerophilum TaxID=1798155 RepID=A0A6N9Z6T6_9BIFI|nr:LacI family DNA-binding transcriptional regulator [Bifidobacterium aerophilum]NEG90332.1 LacI family DNA-binding transcriptional regulator [Bifidobacterium aerophilum]